MLLLLWLAHFVCDYPLQGDFLARAKSAAAPLPGVPWAQAMAAHCAIHAGGVYLVTGSPWLALAEFVAHWTADVLKCKGCFHWALFAGTYVHLPPRAETLVAGSQVEQAARNAFHIDQGLHLLCKVAWGLLAAWGVS